MKSKFNTDLTAMEVEGIKRDRFNAESQYKYGISTEGSITSKQYTGDRMVTIGLKVVF